MGDAIQVILVLIVTINQIISFLCLDTWIYLFAYRKRDDRFASIEIKIMGYHIKTNIEKDYLKFTVSGEQMFEENMKLVFFILQKCMENKIDRVVVDIRGFSEQPGIAADLELANITAEATFGKIAKAAVVYKEETYAYTTFFETVARNRGLNFIAFLNEDDAIEWVTED